MPWLAFSFISTSCIDFFTKAGWTPLSSVSTSVFAPLTWLSWCFIWEKRNLFLLCGAGTCSVLSLFLATRTATQPVILCLWSGCGRSEVIHDNTHQSSYFGQNAGLWLSLQNFSPAWCLLSCLFFYIIKLKKGSLTRQESDYKPTLNTLVACCVLSVWVLQGDDWVLVHVSSCAQLIMVTYPSFTWPSCEPVSNYVSVTPY